MNNVLIIAICNRIVIELMVILDNRFKKFINNAIL